MYASWLRGWTRRPAYELSWEWSGKSDGARSRSTNGDQNEINGQNVLDLDLVLVVGSSGDGGQYWPSGEQKYSLD